jgi:hypothetical protein
MEHVFYRWARVLWLFISTIASALKLPAFVAFLVLSFISCGYLILSCAAIFIARPLMTHKYRGCIIVLSINKSAEPNEEQKVLMSGFDKGITVNTSKQVFRSIW